MKLSVRLLGLEAGGKNIVVLHKNDADILGVHSLERVVITKKKASITAVVNITQREEFKKVLGVYDEVEEALDLKNAEIVEVIPREPLVSKKYIRKKIEGEELKKHEIEKIVADVLSHKLNDLELSAFITAIHINGLSDEEMYQLSRAMINTSKKISFKGIVVDKHSIGGIPGDKTTMILVPIVASLGLKIPKTSTRSITDPAGTADRVGAIMPNNFGADGLKKIVEAVNGCLIWDGNMELDPVDNLFIRIERPLNLDPLIIPSILSKKKIVGSRYVVCDVPVGKYAKLKTIKEARSFSKRMIRIGKKIGLKIVCVLTRTDQPLGSSVGPGVEAREVLESLSNPQKMAPDLREKVLFLSKQIVKLVKKRYDIEDVLDSGLAYKKFREIMEAQGGNPCIKPSDIKIGPYKIIVRSKINGFVTGINNQKIIEIAKLVGAPQFTESGILLNKKIGDYVKKREILFTVYSGANKKLAYIKSFFKKPEGVFSISKTEPKQKSMIISVVK